MMVPEEKPTNRWLVRGLVVGPRLPNGSVKFGHSCRIKIIPDGEATAHLQRAAQIRVDPLSILRQQFGPVGAFSFTPPLAHYTESRHELSITVAATNPPLAAMKAIEEADEYLAALTLAVGQQRYLFAPTIVEKLPDASGIHSYKHVPSGLGLAGVYYPEALKRDDEQNTKTLPRLSEGNKVFRRAFGYLRAAWLLSGVPLGDSALHKAILSNCFLTLETIANDVTKEWRKKNKELTRTQQVTVVEDLTEKLNDSDDAKEKTAAVREAHRALQRADRFFQDLKLKTAGEALGIEERFVELAVELSDLRNKKLNHPGSVGNEDLNDWIYKSEDPRLSDNPGHFGKGEVTAMTYLEAYADHLESKNEGE
jgi:hypothetical protein